MKKESNTFYSLIRKELNLGIKVKSRNVNKELKRNHNNNPGLVNSLSSSYNKAVFHQRLNFDLEESEQNDDIVDDYFKSSIKQKIKVALADCKIPQNENISRNNARKANKPKKKFNDIINQSNDLPALEEEKMNSPKQNKLDMNHYVENDNYRNNVKEECKNCNKEQNIIFANNNNNNIISNHINNEVIYNKEKEDKTKNFNLVSKFIPSKFIISSPKSNVNIKYEENIKSQPQAIRDDDMKVIENYGFIRHTNKKNLNTKKKFGNFKVLDNKNSKNNSNSNSNVVVNLSNNFQKENSKEIYSKDNSGNLKNSSKLNFSDQENSKPIKEKEKLKEIVIISDKDFSQYKNPIKNDIFTPKSNLNKNRIKFLPSIKQKISIGNKNTNSLSKEKKSNYLKTSSNKMLVYEVDLNNFYNYKSNVNVNDNSNNYNNNQTKQPIFNLNRDKNKLITTKSNLKFIRNKSPRSPNTMKINL